MDIKGARDRTWTQGVNRVYQPKLTEGWSNCHPAPDADLTYILYIFSKDSVYALDEGEDRKVKDSECWYMRWRPEYELVAWTYKDENVENEERKPNFLEYHLHFN